MCACGFSRERNYRAETRLGIGECMASPFGALLLFADCSMVLWMASGNRSLRERPRSVR